MQDVTPLKRYVGYLDLLGFSNLVRTDFDRARRIYDAVLEDASLLPTNDQWQAHPSGVEIAAASDSFMVVGERLMEVANWCSGLMGRAFRAGLLVRGSIAFGRHVQQNIHADGKSRHHLLVVSEALVLAVADEKGTARPPAGVTLDASVPQEAIEELDAPPQMAKQRSILFKDGRWIANPFGVFELRWAGDVLRKLLDAHRGTAHEAKYEWMLQLFNDVEANLPLKP